MGEVKDGYALANRIENRYQGFAEIVSGLKEEGIAGFVILQTHPQLKAYVRYRDTQSSLEQSRTSVQQELIDKENKDYPLLSTQG